VHILIIGIGEVA